MRAGAVFSQDVQIASGTGSKPGSCNAVSTATGLAHRTTDPADLTDKNRVLTFAWFKRG